MKKSVYVILTCLAIACACTRESLSDAVDAGKNPAGKEMCSASLRLNVALNETKSQYQVSDLKTIHNVWVLGVASDGFWRTAYFTESDLTKEGSVVTCPSMSFQAGSSVTFYVTANMGDLSSLAISGTTANPAGIEYLLPTDVNFSMSGMPMAAQSSAVTVSAAGTSIPVSLEPLLARLDITINKNGITGSVPAEVLASGELKVMHTNRRMRPFGVSCAVEPTDIFSVVIDRESFSTSSSYDMTHSNVILYVPENSMGNLLPLGSTQWQKGNTGASGKNYATYLEYSCSKNGASDGIDGDLTYRFFLGEDATHNFSVHRNATYECTLDLTWNGLFFEGDWRIDNSDLTDGRRLTISETPHTTSTTFTDMGRLRRNVAAPLYVNFSRDGGTTWVHSAKDIDGWPYGWDLYIDGVKQAAGASATAAGDLGWAYTGSTSGDQLSITPGPSAVLNARHTLQVKSADGRVVSNMVTFDVASPLNFLWYYNKVPEYVAQQNMIDVTGKDSGSTVSFEVTEGTSVVRLATIGGNIYVQAIGAGTATIKATSSTGQEGEYSITIKNPTVVSSWSSATSLWIDGTDSIELFNYTNTSGTVMTVTASETWGEATGTKFAKSLYDIYLKPTIKSISPSVYGHFNSFIDMNDKKLHVQTINYNTLDSNGYIAKWFGIHFNLTITAGVENLTGEVYFKNPYADVTNSNADITLHDFSTMYDYLTASQRSSYRAKTSISLKSGTTNALYASADYVMAQTTSTLSSTGSFDALAMNYSGGNSVSIGVAEHQDYSYHPSGELDLYLHVRNKYDIAAGGERQYYSVPKKIGKASIYLHAAWAVFPSHKTGGLPYSLSTTYRKQNAGDTWDVYFLWGAFINHQSIIRNSEAYRLAETVGTSSTFFTTARSDKQGFSSSGGLYILTDPYGYISNNGAYETGTTGYTYGYKGIGYAVLCTVRSGYSGDTMTWSQWKAYEYTSPFCRRNSMYKYTQQSWTGNGLTGYHYKDPYSPIDANRKGYFIIHFLQDLPTTPNRGYVE